MKLNGTHVIVVNQAGTRLGVITSEIGHNLSILLLPTRTGGMIVAGSIALIDRPQPERLDLTREDIAEDDQSGSIRKITLKR